MNKALREVWDTIAQEAQANNARLVNYVVRDHIRWFLHDNLTGRRCFILTGKSPSDHRAILNVRASVRRNLTTLRKKHNAGT
ncbi:MAG: hypothetical protein ACRCVD_13740 [Halioglobus sp.]